MVQLILFILFLVILANESVILVSAHFCRTKTSCAKGIKIHEPFWIDDGIGSLGEGCNNYPEFRVECAGDGMPVMNISNNLYTLLSIQRHDNYVVRAPAWGYIAVREAGINGQECPQPQQNFSIGSSRFLKISAYNTPKRIFYDCSTPPPNIQVEEIRCHNNSTKHSYVFWAGQIPGGFDWFRYCERNVLTYVDDDNIVQGLRWGFTLRWNAPVNCTDCELSGGRCSSNDTIGIVTCYCPGFELPVIDEICPQEFNNNSSNNLGYKMALIGIIAASIIAFCMYNLLCIYRTRIYSSIVSYWRKKITGLTNVEVFLENYGYLAIQRYTYSDIKKLTNSFKETLGQGGYGSVFKGKLRDGHLVAVKVLNEAKGKGEDFINEVAAIGRTNHVNVVSLLGFCTEKNKRALVYEYMPNGSLEKFIYSEQNSSTSSPLGREKLYEIALGIARGLEYLHRGCTTRVLHLDIKPHNILLDQDFCPRISDFGLAKLSPTKESLVSMVGTRGTPGYIAPEVYCRNFGGVSHKSDVYSYGMMVLEMIGEERILTQQ